MQTVSSALMEAVFTGLWLDLKMKAIMTENNLKPNKIAVCFFVIFFLAPLHCACILAPGLNVLF